MPIAVVINERAAGAKPWLLVPQPGRLGYVRKSAVVVVVSDANSRSPPERMQTCFLGNICKCPVTIVFVQPVRGAFRGASEPRAAQHKQIHPSVVVVINEGATASR